MKLNCVTENDWVMLYSSRNLGAGSNIRPPAMSCSAYSWHIQHMQPFTGICHRQFIFLFETHGTSCHGDFMTADVARVVDVLGHGQSHKADMAFCETADQRHPPAHTCCPSPLLVASTTHSCIQISSSLYAHRISFILTVSATWFLCLNCSRHTSQFTRHKIVNYSCNTVCPVLAGECTGVFTCHVSCNYVMCRTPWPTACFSTQFSQTLLCFGWFTSQGLF